MVKTGARATSLQELLVRVGFKAVASRSGPKVVDLSPGRLEDILNVYRALGGTSSSPKLRPGSWDLAFDGDLVVELDEELHFNRYRRSTLEPQWTAELPWRRDYLVLTEEDEAECLAAAKWGKRWTNPSCEALFGPADPPGSFESNGAPRWKQRALYDAMKDAAAIDARHFRLARIATHDLVGGVRLDSALKDGSEIDLDALRQLVGERST